MLGWLIKDAARSLRRDRVVALVMIASLALGSGVWALSHSVLALQTRAPFPASERVFHVERTDPSGLAAHTNWRGYEFFGQLPRVVVPFEVGQRVLGSNIPARAAVTFGSMLLARGADGVAVPVKVRFCSRALFAIFRLDFDAGGPWVDGSGGIEAVVTKEFARNWFGSRGTVGRRLEIQNHSVKVVGVLAPSAVWRRFYDISVEVGADAIYLPMDSAELLGAGPEVFYPSTARTDDAYRWTNSRDGWIQAWVELRRVDDADRFLAAVSDPDQGVRVRTFENWRQDVLAAVPAYRLFELFAAVGLVACSMNLLRLMLAKFRARSDEVGLRRALGATWRMIFWHRMAEVLLVGVIAGVVSVGVAAVGIWIFNRQIVEKPFPFVLGFYDAILSAKAAVVAAVVAGVYPAWRSARTQAAACLGRR